MAKKLFGTDGIRGVPGVFPLDDATLFRAGRSLGGYLRGGNGAAPGAVLIGMDTRESGPHIAGEIAAGLAASGVSAASAGVITTPGIACLVRQKKFSAGIVISASHNPYHDNGVKLFSSKGMKFPDEIEEQLEGEILNGKLEPAEALWLKEDATLDEAYLEFLRGRLLPSASLKGMKIVLDCANGAASSLGPQLFQSLGANVTAINNSPDGRNINKNCGSLHPESLQKRVVAEKAALGVAFDGDADRALFVCASGKLVDGDGILLAAARYLKSTGKLKCGRVVGTTMANLGLERVLAAEGITLVRTDVGDRYVLEEMIRGGCNLGGEQSGHIIFLDDATTGDGLLTAVKIASLVALRGPLGQLVSGLKVYPQTILNVKVRSKPPLESLPEVARALKEAASALGDSGRIVLRYSGTEPKARVMVEAEHAEDVERYAASVASAIQAALGV
ncbi:MAG TPA: phosphoglucosamine mutase [Candidatus Limnocylindrales bacterium]|nr:phosphoglucosamine mutase [Candidatus Limnocylindrales bacterium]